MHQALGERPFFLLCCGLTMYVLVGETGYLLLLSDCLTEFLSHQSSESKGCYKQGNLRILSLKPRDHHQWESGCDVQVYACLSMDVCVAWCVVSVGMLKYHV